jgi:hypothetical protein
MRLSVPYLRVLRPSACICVSAFWLAPPRAAPACKVARPQTGQRELHAPIRCTAAGEKLSRCSPWRQHPMPSGAASPVFRLKPASGMQCAPRPHAPIRRGTAGDRPSQGDSWHQHPMPSGAASPVFRLKPASGMQCAPRPHAPIRRGTKTEECAATQGGCERLPSSPASAGVMSQRQEPMHLYGTPRRGVGRYQPPPNPPPTLVRLAPHPQAGEGCSAAPTPSGTPNGSAPWPATARPGARRSRANRRDAEVYAMIAWSPRGQPSAVTAHQARQ